MAKLKVTKELSSTIKHFRKNKNITAKSLSTAVHKSPSYISKLEKLEIQSIGDSELEAIFNNIIDGHNFHQDILPTLVTYLDQKYDISIFSQQLWLIHFDVVTRPIIIPDVVIDDINNRITHLGISRKEFIKLVNANQDSGLNNSFPPNELVEYELQNRDFLLIRLDISNTELDSLLDKKESFSYYYCINAIIFQLIRLEKFSLSHLSFENSCEVLYDTHAYLEKHQITSFTNYTKLFAYRNESYGRSLLDSFSDSNSEILNELIALFKTASEYDLLNTTREMEHFRNNMIWDQAFMLNLLCKPFSKIGQMSHGLKKQLLEEISQLILEYEHIPYAKKTFEFY